jgi:uncharacterized protein YbjT (DUF2867 family)
MQNLPFRSAAGKGRAGMVDARDVAAVAAAIAAAPAPHAGNAYWITGPELISNYDVAAVLSKLLGRTITYRELTFEENKDAMVRAGVPEPVAQQNAQAFSLTADSGTTPSGRSSARYSSHGSGHCPRPQHRASSLRAISYLTEACLT